LLGNRAVRRTAEEKQGEKGFSIPGDLGVDLPLSVNRQGGVKERGSKGLFWLTSPSGSLSVDREGGPKEE
jgi:hypothetical protein